MGVVLMYYHHEQQELFSYAVINKPISESAAEFMTYIRDIKVSKKSRQISIHNTFLRGHFWCKKE